MKYTNITDTIRYIGADDRELDLFESQYGVPNGVSYNSYVILDEKTVVMDTVDARKTDEWLVNLEEALAGRVPDYLVVSHMEPDHSASLQILSEKYPAMQIVGNAKTFVLMEQFFEMDFSKRTVQVKEGDTLNLGLHTLNFLMAPMVHWPEVMVTYESSSKVLFSADAFGKFGTLDTEEDWTCEARRYYFNIVGKYGVQVQGLLQRASSQEIKIICPLHGPILKENIEYYLDKYNIWSSYEPEDKGILIAHASIYGNTKMAAEQLAKMLREKGVEKVVVTDLTRDDMSEAVEDAFRYDRLVLAAATYDGGLFPRMEEFLHHLKSKNYQKRKVALIENGSWGPAAGRHMKGILEKMKEVVVVPTVVTIKSKVKKETVVQMEHIVEELL